MTSHSYVVLGDPDALTITVEGAGKELRVVITEHEDDNPIPTREIGLHSSSPFTHAVLLEKVLGAAFGLVEAGVGLTPGSLEAADRWVDMLEEIKGQVEDARDGLREAEMNRMEGSS